MPYPDLPFNGRHPRDPCNYCSPLPARRSTTLFIRPHHAVCRSDRQSRPQINHVWLCRSAAYHVITRRPLVRCSRSARVEQAAVATSSRWLGTLSSARGQIPHHFVWLKNPDFRVINTNQSNTFNYRVVVIDTTRACTKITNVMYYIIITVTYAAI